MALSSSSVGDIVVPAELEILYMPLSRHGCHPPASPRARRGLDAAASLEPVFFRAGIDPCQNALSHPSSSTGPEAFPASSPALGHGCADVADDLGPGWQTCSTVAASYPI